MPAAASSPPAMRKIVLGYDGSDASRRALDLVAGLGDGGREVTIVSVPPVRFTSLGPVTPDEETFAEAKRHLDEALERLAAKGIEARGVDTSGVPAEVIVEEAQRLRADLVVVGTGRKNVAERLVLGSVSTAVVHEAPCNVLVVR
jgi:nucleotide-binding universal stress UspA family protein